MKELVNILNIILKELPKFTSILIKEYDLILSVNYVSKLRSNISIINNKYIQLNKLIRLNKLRYKKENILKLKAPYINYKILSSIWKDIIIETTKVNYYNNINTMNLKEIISKNYTNIKIN
ncbi:MAG: hypothetical protein N4P89_02235 [Candidatus Lightella neohaematopini]|nr:hypothetical protein [Candidatus Lightella neohaematopini]MCV2529028.1 hypothetical protein [Candidatus Lightella neohaematopini]